MFTWPWAHLVVRISATLTSAMTSFVKVFLVAILHLLLSVNAEYRSGMLRRAKLDESCEFDMECYTKQMVCKNGRCVCMEGQVASEADRCIARVNAQCYTANDCLSLPRSDCEKHRCICRSGNTPSSDGAQCLEDAATLGSPCQESTQCLHTLGVFGYCSNQGTCLCMTSYHYSVRDQQCIASVYLEGKCVNDTQCVNSAGDGRPLTCGEDKFCRCADGYVEEDGECIDGATIISLSATSLFLCFFVKLFIT